MTTELSETQLRTYAEQLNVPGMSKDAQARLLAGRVIIFGGCGSSAVVARTLAKAGVGELVVVDGSIEALSSLESALKTSSQVSADTQVILAAQQLDDLKTEDLLKCSNVAIDSLANWQQKLMLSDMCMRTGTPLIHAGIAGFRYQVFSMLPGKSACLRCALPLAGIDDVPLAPLKIGKIEAVLEMVGAWQAIEAIKIIAHVGATQGNELFKFDCLSGEFEIVRGLDPKPDCPDCGRRNRR